MISEVIGLRGSSGAFVFGAYSFLDKISGGIAIFFMTNNSSFDDLDINYIRLLTILLILNYRWITVLVPSISLVFSWLLIVAPIKN